MQGVEYTDGGETADGLAACMLVRAGVRWCVLGYGAPVPREPARERVAAAHRLEVGPAAAAVGAHHDHVRHAVEEVEEAERHHLAGLGPGSGLGPGLRKARLASCYAPCWRAMSRASLSALRGALHGALHGALRGALRGAAHGAVRHLVVAEGADQPGQPGGAHDVELAHVGRLAPAPLGHLDAHVDECRGNVERLDGGQAGGGEREDEALIRAEPVEGLWRLGVPQEQRAERAHVQRGLLSLQLPAQAQGMGAGLGLGLQFGLGLVLGMVLGRGQRLGQGSGQASGSGERAVAASYLFESRWPKRAMKRKRRPRSCFTKWWMAMYELAVQKHWLPPMR